MKKGKILHMFPGSNTPQGFKGFLAENLQGMERVFILKGGPGCGKSTLMNKIAQNMIERGYDVEVWLCSSAPESLDGVVVPELAVAVVDGTAPHVVEPGCPGVVEEIVNLGEHWNQSRLREHKEEIKQLGQQIEASFERAYQELAEMAAVRGEQPSADLAVTDAEVTQLCRGLAEEIFGQKHLRVRKFFAEAITRNGRQSYAQELSLACQRRYLVNGAADQVLAGVAELAAQQGHNLDLYYSCMAPEQLEMVIIPGLSVALVDCACPELEARYEDVLLNLRPEGEAELAEEADAAEQIWLHYLDNAVLELDNEHRLHDELESYYIAAMDFEALDAVCKDIFGKIWQLAAERS